jgi:aspartate aminotransferase
MQNNRDILMQEMRSFTDVRCFKPQGTFYAMPDFRAYCGSGLIKNSMELSKFLLKKALVVTVPGKEFGMENFLRLSYSGTGKDLTEGLDRMKWALDPNAPPEIYIGDRKIVRDWI